jgi:hypothetical protein
MADRVVRVVTSLSGRYRGEVTEHPSGGFRVEVLRWTEEWVEGYGKVAAFWERVSRGVTFADTVERAEVLAREALVTWEPAAE